MSYRNLIEMIYIIYLERLGKLMFSSLVEYTLLVVVTADDVDAAGTEIIIMSMDVSDMEDMGTSCESSIARKAALADSWIA